MNQDITDTATALAGITAETRYFFQNQTGRTLFIETATSTPTDVGNAVKAESTGPLSVGFFRAEEGESVFVWSSKGGGAVVYFEAP